MNTENLAGELRGLAARHDADHRAREMLNDAASHIEQLEAGNKGLEATVNGVIEAIGGDWQDVDTLAEDVAKLVKAQKQRDGQEETPSKGAVSDQWLGDVVDFLHLLAGDLAHDSRLMAITARQLILNAPRLSAELENGVWHDWYGGNIPVDGGEAVEVRFRDGTDSGKIFASHLLWGHSGEGDDIVAWRRVN